MTKRAEELAKQIAAEANTCCERMDGYEEAIAAKALALLEQYGREVREACANISDENCGRDCEGTGRIIREMPLP